MIKVKAVGDGNCLFRCFSHFLYNNQKYHRKIRLSIVENITEKWDNYKSFIIGSYNDILDGNDYKRFMSKNCIYGGDIEIKSFSELYNVRVTVCFENSNIFHNFGDSQNNVKKRKENKIIVINEKLIIIIMIIYKLTIKDLN